MWIALTAYLRLRSGLRGRGALAPGSHARPPGSHSFSKNLSDRSLAQSHPYLPAFGGERRATGANAQRLRRPERHVEDMPLKIWRIRREIKQKSLLTG